ncbi:flagellar basal body L-ring protein FlgH [Agarilytica rhodophyticola]|uniref:flagellar basal body L-ring protein FlgH n=1 Tax=Agarilytica rhodophyticola TaxID=1737490 RepID=UPI001FE90F39|nr:flagellar basal body L-ring protein FlgH [Agarilytica rhodophyticola]
MITLRDKPFSNASNFLVMLTMCCVLSACVIQAPPRPNDPYYAPVLKTMPERNTPHNGSLFSDNSGLILFSDGKAKDIGDIITVVLQEQTSSSKSSNVEITKENDVELAPTGEGTILGGQLSIGEYNLGTALSGTREFTGEAGADQSNRLTGNISVTVVDKFPNGTLVIRGEKWITLNRGDEFIRISGLIRPGDVTPENTIQSNRIANARITYSGTGELADSQEMGWLSRFFNSAIWPF